MMQLRSHLRLDYGFIFYWLELNMILVEVDNLQDVPSPYIQIKGVDKEAVAAAGSMLKLDGSYTTKSYLQIILERLPALEANSGGVQTQQAAKLQELVEFIQSQFYVEVLGIDMEEGRLAWVCAREVARLQSPLQVGKFLQSRVQLKICSAESRDLSGGKQLIQ
ncbi:hypothetical protein Cgig2_031723 [Carnegiea gigantea]|uniref:Uncharacterized protein n=1 Tax=Carnegiea gigantea TaxID=171969 RepID=A0A9Q1KRM4_9CARY|nr:hypothetical protein Cgig2_031723 [Carnegiea gigantea]